MRLRLSLKQLFLIGLLASPIWAVVFVALQGRLWGVGALYGQLISVTVILLMMFMFLISDRLAAVLYRRRSTRFSTVPIASEVSPATQSPATQSPATQSPATQSPSPSHEPGQVTAPSQSTESSN